MAEGSSSPPRDPPHPGPANEEFAGGNEPKRRRFRALRVVTKIFRRKSTKRSASSSCASKNEEGAPGTSMKSRSTSELLVHDCPDDRESDLSVSYGSGLSLSHDSIFAPDSEDGVDSSDQRRPDGFAGGARRFSIKGLKDQLRSKMRARQDSDDDDAGLPHSPCTSPTTAEVLLQGLGSKSGKSRSSDGSLMSMGSSETDNEDGAAGFGASRRIFDRRLHNADPELDVGATTLLSNQAARHKISVRPKRNHAVPQNRRLHQVTTGRSLPTTPEDIEESPAAAALSPLPRSAPAVIKPVLPKRPKSGDVTASASSALRSPPASEAASIAAPSRDSSHLAAQPKRPKTDEATSTSLKGQKDGDAVTPTSSVQLSPSVKESVATAAPSKDSSRPVAPSKNHISSDEFVSPSDVHHLPLVKESASNSVGGSSSKSHAAERKLQHEIARYGQRHLEKEQDDHELEAEPTTSISNADLGSSSENGAKGDREEVSHRKRPGARPSAVAPEDPVSPTGIVTQEASNRVVISVPSNAPTPAAASGPISPNMTVVARPLPRTGSGRRRSGRIERLSQHFEGAVTSDPDSAWSEGTTGKEPAPLEDHHYSVHVAARKAVVSDGELGSVQTDPHQRPHLSDTTSGTNGTDVESEPSTRRVLPNGHPPVTLPSTELDHRKTHRHPDLHRVRKAKESPSNAENASRAVTPTEQSKESPPIGDRSAAGVALEGDVSSQGVSQVKTRVRVRKVKELPQAVASHAHVQTGDEGSELPSAHPTSRFGQRGTATAVLQTQARLRDPKVKESPLEGTHETKKWTAAAGNQVPDAPRGLRPAPPHDTKATVTAAPEQLQGSSHVAHRVHRRERRMRELPPEGNGVVDRNASAAPPTERNETRAAAQVPVRPQASKARREPIEERRGQGPPSEGGGVTTKKRKPVQQQLSREDIEELEFESTSSPDGKATPKFSLSSARDLCAPVVRPLPAHGKSPAEVPPARFDFPATAREVTIVEEQRKPKPGLPPPLIADARPLEPLDIRPYTSPVKSSSREQKSSVVRLDVEWEGASATANLTALPDRVEIPKAGQPAPSKVVAVTEPAQQPELFQVFLRRRSLKRKDGDGEVKADQDEPKPASPKLDAKTIFEAVSPRVERHRPMSTPTPTDKRSAFFSDLRSPTSSEPSAAVSGDLSMPPTNARPENDKRSTAFGQLRSTKVEDRPTALRSVHSESMSPTSGDPKPLTSTDPRLPFSKRPPETSRPTTSNPRLHIVNNSVAANPGDARSVTHRDGHPRSPKGQNDSPRTSGVRPSTLAVREAGRRLDHDLENGDVGKVLSGETFVQRRRRCLSDHSSSVTDAPTSATKLGGPTTPDIPAIPSEGVALLPWKEDTSRPSTLKSVRGDAGGKRKVAEEGAMRPVDSIVIDDVIAITTTTTVTVSAKREPLPTEQSRLRSLSTPVRPAIKEVKPPEVTPPSQIEIVDKDGGVPNWMKLAQQRRVSRNKHTEGTQKAPSMIIEALPAAPPPSTATPPPPAVPKFVGSPDTLSPSVVGVVEKTGADGRALQWMRAGQQKRDIQKHQMLPEPVLIEQKPVVPASTPQPPPSIPSATASTRSNKVLEMVSSFQKLQVS